jgi:hypothetical protein
VDEDDEDWVAAALERLRELTNLRTPLPLPETAAEA